jgi:uncharacterized repeat protein (TIGR03803 family)
MRFKFAAGLLLALCAASGARAATFETIHTFCQAGPPCVDGSIPEGLTMDARGDLYGATFEGGKGRLGGVIYEMIPNANRSAWTTVKLYEFCRGNSCNRGSLPLGKLVLDTAGNLYGVTEYGGSGDDRATGTVFELMPSADRTQWTYKVLHRFCRDANCADGKNPNAGLTYVGAASGALYDGVSPLYGTTVLGGSGVGVAYRMVLQGGAYHQQVIHDFGQGTDGAYLYGPLIADASGNLFGTTLGGGAHSDPQTGNGGTVFELSPGAHGQWTESLLYSFNALAGGADGFAPQGGLVMDQAGALYGTTAYGGPSQGTLFKLAFDGSAWQHTVLHDFCAETNCTDGASPMNTLSIDGAGTVYGTVSWGGKGYRTKWIRNGAGMVFSWDGAFHDLHDFCGAHRCTDGANPIDQLLIDGTGTIFGAAGSGGAPDSVEGGSGTVFAITP